MLGHKIFYCKFNRACLLIWLLNWDSTRRFAWGFDDFQIICFATNPTILDLLKKSYCWWSLFKPWKTTLISQFLSNPQFYNKIRQAINCCSLELKQRFLIFGFGDPYRSCKESSNACQLTFISCVAWKNYLKIRRKDSVLLQRKISQ